MVLMQWTPTMSVGLHELDQDHKRLIDIINRLAEVSGEAPNPEAVRQCLVGLMRYAETHFAREEGVMKACGFEGIEHHMEEHKDFVEKVRTLRQGFDDAPEAESQGANDELLQFLRAWLNHHILIEDMAYRPVVEHNPAATEAARSFRPSQVWWGNRARA